jgi:hypothetical protein
MKTAATVIILVVMPLGFFVLAAIIVNRMLAKWRRRRPDRAYDMKTAGLSLAAPSFIKSRA